MNTFTKTIYFRRGREWAFRILSKWDDSILAQGQARKKREAEEKAKQEHGKLRNHEQNDHRD